MARETLTTTRFGQLGGQIHVAVTIITDGIGAVIETVQGLRGASAFGD